MAHPTLSALPARRDASIDVARGIAIIAIVLGHVDRGLASAGILDPESPLFAWSDRFLYSWHLVVFAFLSGVFLPRTRDRGTLVAFLRLRVLEWGYLYLVWSLLQGSLHLLTGDAANAEFLPIDLLEIWRPDGQLWFLPWLMIAAVLGAVLRPWAGRRRAVVLLGASGLLAVVVWGTAGPVIGTQGLALLVFYTAGSVLGAERLSAALRCVPRILEWFGGAVGMLACAALVLLPLPSPTDGRPPAPVDAIPLGILATVLGSLGVVLIASAVARGPLARPLAPAGRRSLEIFLAHILATAGTRILLLRLGIEDPAIHIATGLVVGVIGPLLGASVLQRLRFPWLFRMPRHS